MRILHVLSQVFISGPEFYVAALAEKHCALGHKIYVVSDTLTAGVKGEFRSRPIANRRYLQRIKNVWFLRKFIKEEGIDIVHAHSRAASWVSFYATRGTRVPLVSTVHGRQFPHASARWFDIYGDRVVAVCENLREHLVGEMRMRRDKIVLIRNGFGFSGPGPAGAGPEPSRGTGGGKSIAVIGRTNGPKGENIVKVTEQVIRPLLAEHGGLRAYIIGGDAGDLPGDGFGRVKRVAEESGGRLTMPGFVDDLPGWIARSDVVICAGRVAVEALYLGRPVVAVGEDVSHGLITEANLDDAMASNFGDILPTSVRKKPDFDLLRTHVRGALTAAGHVPSLRSNIIREYDVETVSRDVMRVYESVRMRKRRPRHTPVLMYHKVPDKPFETDHRVYITAKDFSRHLEFFRKRGFTPITFKEYREFAGGVRDMKHFPARPIILTFDDGYRDNLTNLLPMMKESGFKGVLFLLGDASADYNFWDADRGDHYDPLLSLEEKRAFVAAGWEIGAHSMTHPDLTAMDFGQARWEIEESKRRLEADLGTEVISFAYPGGKVDERVKRLVAQAGFSFGVSTDTGGLHIEDDRLQVFRVNMFPHDRWFQVWKKSSSWYRKYYRRKRGK
jgi:peptidoglycan/xylan/chitin deacetylase (PgdA/CDA1 family)/glycosyltransferase involved in cell wall biosynthesis